ncbi:hypothetical protein GNI_053920 [Gregarina niphandrodes]|uniref:Uncharacterized protein n=1 Tax=Gregarina niphandrodes TaxID=110365 RepID=A0A023B929_GRENI|nr:hypothetical protein GNI_053920 [Gregarina niphandrodes]EZG70943.1 hypothetical protein GNI_053920 [Gregarina niphandrodes]|eukprot:XP_011129858.1 hypothetical protein GNI_053920 [Gregarina niphandrodes]
MTKQLIVYGLSDFLKPIERETLTLAMGGSVATFLKPADCAWCGLLYRNEDLAPPPRDTDEAPAEAPGQADSEASRLPGEPPTINPLVQPGQTHCQCLNRFYVFGRDAPAAMVGIDCALKAVRCAERDRILKYVLSHSRAVDILRACRRLNPQRALVSNEEISRAPRQASGEERNRGPGHEDLVFLPLWEYYQSEWAKVHRRLCFVERSEAFRARAVEQVGWTYYDLFIGPVFRFAERVREQERTQEAPEAAAEAAAAAAALKLRAPSGRKRLMGSVRFRARDRQHRLAVLAKCFAAQHLPELLAWLDPEVDFVTLWTRSDRLLELLVSAERFVLGGRGHTCAVVHMFNRLQRPWLQDLFTRHDARDEDLELCRQLWTIAEALAGAGEDADAALQHAVVQTELLDHPMWCWNEELQPAEQAAEEPEEGPEEEEEPVRTRRKRFRTHEQMARESREARRQAMDILDTLSRMLDRAEAS